MPRMAMFISGQIFFLLSVILTGCLPPRLKPEGIVGLWIEIKTPIGPIIPSGDCGSFEFFANGKFAAQNIVREYFMLPGVSPTLRISTSGTWELEPPPQDPFAFQRVNLKFEPSEGYPARFESSIRISENEHGYLLEQWIGESRAITFARKDRRECQ